MKLSLSEKYNDLGFGQGPGLDACPRGLLVNSLTEVALSKICISF